MQVRTAGSTRGARKTLFASHEEPRNEKATARQKPTRQHLVDSRWPKLGHWGTRGPGNSGLLDHSVGRGSLARCRGSISRMSPREAVALLGRRFAEQVSEEARCARDIRAAMSNRMGFVTVAVLFLFVVIAPAVGCGGGSGSAGTGGSAAGGGAGGGSGGGGSGGASQPPGPDFSPYAGIYQVISDTMNENGCAADGGTAWNAISMLVLFPTSRFGNGDELAVIDCASASGCRATSTSQGIIPAAFSADFSRVEADQSLTGTSFGTDSANVAHVANSVLVKTGDQIRIEQREYLVPCTMTGGKCDRQAAVNAAASAPCANLRVVSANFQESL